MNKVSRNFLVVSILLLFLVMVQPFAVFAAGLISDGGVSERLTEITIFAAIVQAARETANTEQVLKLQSYQLGDPSPDFDKLYPVRLMLKKKSNALPKYLKMKCLNYLLQYPYWQTVYHAYLFESFGAAPLFTPNGKRFSMIDQVYAGRNEFARILAQVYACGGGSEGWKGLVVELSRQQVPKKCLSAIGNRLTKGLKADSKVIGSKLFQSYCSGQMTVIHNPLMAPTTGVVSFPNGWNGYPVYVVGAWETEQGLWTCISHELTHPILNAIHEKSEKFRATLDKTAHCFESVTGNRWGYDEWGSYFPEEFIRAASSKIEGGFQKQFQHHKTIADMLAKFERSDWTLEELLIKTLERIEKESKSIEKRAKDMNRKTELNSKNNGIYANKIIHLYKEQLGDPTPFYNEFLQAYEKFFSKDARQKISVAVREIDQEELKEAVFRVDEALQELYQEFTLALPDVILPKTVLFVGDMVSDGHGIQVKQDWYLFINLNIVVVQKRHKSDMKWYLAHEFIHAIHYSLSPEFFKGGHLKFMMAEGIATYVSMKICAISENKAFWGGFIDDSQIMQWRKNAAENKPNVAKKIEKLVLEGGFDPDIDNRLFNVCNMENLEQKRTGYLYGFEIVSKLAVKKTSMQLLKTPYSEMQSHIMDYFAINCKH